MAKVELKTKESDASVEDFLNSLTDEKRRSDAFRVLEIYKRVTGKEPRMWGPAIIGFGHQILTYPNGRTLDWMEAGFSPRKHNLSLYVICGSKRQPDLLKKLGKHTTSSASCLYIKRLSDVDEKVLEEIIKDAFEYDTKTSSAT